MNHRSDCRKNRTVAKKLQSAFDEDHPNCCKKCNGWGGKEYAQTFHEPSDWVDCDECVGMGKCPLCANSIDDDDNCVCGWEWAGFDNKTRPIVECICF